MNRQPIQFQSPFGNNNPDTYDAVQKAKQLRQNTRIPRVRTMKKILKKIKEQRKNV